MLLEGRGGKGIEVEGVVDGGGRGVCMFVFVDGWG